MLELILQFDNYIHGIVVNIVLNVYLLQTVYVNMTSIHCIFESKFMSKLYIYMAVYILVNCFVYNIILQLK